jgi:hypothetical protein
VARASWYSLTSSDVAIRSLSGVPVAFRDWVLEDLWSGDWVRNERGGDFFGSNFYEPSDFLVGV